MFDFILGKITVIFWVLKVYDISIYRSQADQEIAIDFMTCVRMFALAKNQTECTAERIRAVIAADEVKLNLTLKSANVEECWPGQWYSN